MRIALFELVRHTLCSPDIHCLCRLVTAYQYQVDGLAAAREIDAVPGPDIDSHLTHTPADGFAIPEIAVPRGGYSGEDLGLRLAISQGAEPSIELRRA